MGLVGWTPGARAKLAALCVELRDEIARREGKAATIRDVARAARVSHNAWSRWENGRGVPGRGASKHRIRVLAAKYTNAEIDRLTTGELGELLGMES